jgi:hypothetical protein
MAAHKSEISLKEARRRIGHAVEGMETSLNTFNGTPGKKDPDFRNKMSEVVLLMLARNHTVVQGDASLSDLQKFNAEVAEAKQKKAREVRRSQRFSYVLDELAPAAELFGSIEDATKAKDYQLVAELSGKVLHLLTKQVEGKRPSELTNHANFMMGAAKTTLIMLKQFDKVTKEEFHRYMRTEE